MNKKNTKTRVVVFSPVLDAVSGVSTHVKILLASTLANDFELFHFQVGSEGHSENIFQLLARLLFSPFQLAVFLIRNDPRIVHINTSMDLKSFWRDFCYLIVVRLLGCHVVTQFHSGYGPQRHFSNPILALSMRQFLRWSDVVVTLSTQALREHREFDSRIRVDYVPNAIDTASLSNTSRDHNFDQALRLVFVGRLVNTKGLFEAIEAAALLKTEGVPYIFSIAGSGPDESTLRKLIAEKGLEKEVKLLGPIFNEAKIRLWMDSDVLVFPTYFEGLPYSLLEAMAAGCVPVTCSVGGIPDVMCDGEHGLFVPLQDARAVAASIRRLDANRKELFSMSQASRQRIADHYTVDRLAARFSVIYKQFS